MSSTSFKAVVWLALGGFGRQALMVNRSMFEGMAVAHWVAAHPDQAEDRFRRAGDFAVHRLRATLLAVDPHAPDDLEGEMVGEELEQARRDFGRFNEKMWTGHRSIWDLTQDIADQWEEPGRSTLLQFLQTLQQQGTETMHATVTALVGHSVDPAAVREGVPGMELRIGPGPEEVGTALAGAFFIQLSLLELLIDHFSLGASVKARLRQIRDEHQGAFLSDQ